MQLPEDFVKSMQPLIGEEWEAFTEALRQSSPVSIRVNPRKNDTSNTPHSRVSWCNTGYYLDKRPSFTFDPLFHTGTYYVQEASSMFVEQVFKQYIQGDVKVLDLCAAPGGKSTHIASLITENSLLVSNEVIKSRANILSENITKAGYPNVVVTNNDPSDIGKLKHFFDVVLVDAPCSGEGMFRKDRNAVAEWSLANVQLCKERQQRIISHAWDALKPGGILIYSTCTYNRDEDEDNMAWMLDNLKAEVLPLDILPEWNISPSYDGNADMYHFFPHKVKGEGFFLSIVRKRSNEEHSDSSSFAKRNRKGNTKPKAQVLPEVYRNYIKDSENYTFFNKNNSWFAFPRKLYDDLLEIVSILRLVSAGIYVGEVKGKDFIPQHSLAMSIALNRDCFTCHEVDKDTAIAYLRKEALSFPHLAKGYILLTYKNKPLGFIKNIGNRANNLYPNEWRIRSAYQPEE